MKEDELQMNFVEGYKTVERAASDAWPPPLAGFTASGVCMNDWLARIVGMARSKVQRTAVA